MVYAAFGFIGHGSALLWVFWPLYGIYAAMTEGVEKAFVAKLAPAESKATALGISHTIIGIGLLPASIIAVRSLRCSRRCRLCSAPSQAW